MSKRKRQTKSPIASSPKTIANPPESRPNIHSERRPSPYGDYEIRIVLELGRDGKQEIVGKAISPSGASIEAMRTPLSEAVISDASRMFGVPPQLNAALFREILESCRKCVEDDVRRQKQSNR